MLRLLQCEIHRQEMKDRSDRLRPNKSKPQLWEYNFDGIVSFQKTIGLGDGKICNNSNEIQDENFEPENNDQGTSTQIVDMVVPDPALDPLYNDLQQFTEDVQIGDGPSVEESTNINFAALEISSCNLIKRNLQEIKIMIEDKYEQCEALKKLVADTEKLFQQAQTRQISANSATESLPRQKILIETQRGTSKRRRSLVRKSQQVAKKTCLPPRKKKKHSPSKNKDPKSGRIA